MAIFRSGHILCVVFSDLFAQFPNFPIFLSQTHRLSHSIVLIDFSLSIYYLFWNERTTIFFQTVCVFHVFFCVKGKCGNGQNCARMFEHEHKHFYHYLKFTHQRISIAENQTICRHCSECVSVIFFSCVCCHHCHCLQPRSRSHSPAIVVIFRSSFLFNLFSVRITK